MKTRQHVIVPAHLYRPALRFWMALSVFFCLGLASLGSAQAAEYQSVPVYIKEAGGLPDFFEKCKQNEPMLIAFLRQMPKGADLHNHASGAFTSEVYIDEAIAQNYFFDRTAKGFTKTQPADGFPARNMVTDFSLLGEALSALTMGNAAASSGESGHDHFFLAFRRFPPLSDEAKQQAFVDLFLHNAFQRVAYMEIMSTPPTLTGEQASPDQTELLGGASPLGQDNEIDDLQSAWQTANGQLPLLGASMDNAIPGWNPSIPEVAYIASVSRDKFPSYDPDKPFDAVAYRQYFTQEVTSRFEDMKTGKYVGMTILSPEDAWISRTQFDLQMEVIDSIWTNYKDNGFTANMNLHGGELTPEYSPFKHMNRRISDTVHFGHSKRIGHGVSIAWEQDLLPFLKEMKGNIAVEICLTSNNGILNINESKKHPFLLYWEAGVPVVLCTDDEGISRSNITLEYVRAAQWFNLSYGQMKWLSLWSLEHSFLSGESLFENGDMSRPKTSVPRDSKKAAMQKRVYDDFCAFENEMIEYMKIWPGMR